MILIRILVAAAVTYILSTIFPSIVVESWEAAFIYAVILTLINQTVGRLVKFSGCLIQLMTFGLFGLFVNVLIIRWVDYYVSGTHIDGWGAALVLSLAVSFATWVTLSDFNKPQ